MGSKQCAGCGSQMASAARECPVCGRGSRTSDLRMIAFLGVLLLGIGLASGLIPIKRPAAQPEAVPIQVAAPPRPETPKATSPRQTSQARRPTVAAADRHPPARKRASAAKAVCENPDTSAVESSLRSIVWLRERTAGHRAARNLGGAPVDRSAGLLHRLRLDRTLTQSLLEVSSRFPTEERSMPQEEHERRQVPRQQ